MYQVKRQFQGIPELTTRLDGKNIALNAGFTKVIPASAGGPEKRIEIPLATQAQLRKLFESGNPCVELVADEPAKKGKANESSEQD